MKNLTASEIRQSFQDFYRSKQHEIVPSSPVVLPADPTLMFVNAGMNPFKEIFLGARESRYKRVANTQKCIRVSGKHNDLEDVGRDTYHHTFFEMLGNWSFGDYYKREAILWSWELLTSVWGMPKDRLYATVYKDDQESEDLWKELTDIDPTHIQRFGDKDNFWEMGETGPCGPCSELHIDLTEDGSGAGLVNADSPEVIEIWNLVFIQYNRRADRSLEELPSKHVDTGMGFERVVAVLQGKKSNYDTDLFVPIIDKICELSGKPYEGEHAMAMRVIADHLRTFAIAMSDGVVPSNEGRGYVLRRLLRRAVRYGRNLEMDGPFMGKLFPVLEEILGDVFPNLRERRETILSRLKSEEESFSKTISRGINLFNEAADKVDAAGETIIAGEDAFVLYDTFGFPLDLTVLMAEERGLSVDEDAFDTIQETKKEENRPSGKNGVSGEADLISDLVSEGIKSKFIGYTASRSESTVLKILGPKGAVETLAAGEEGQVIVSETPFYAESGGQIGDVGSLSNKNTEGTVKDTQCPVEGLIMHTITLDSGSLSVGDSVNLSVDLDRRHALERNHSATHLLNHALRESVDQDIRQAGSYVGPDRLRFDFSYPEALSSDQLDELERRVNAWVMNADEVKITEMALKDVEGSGIIAVFDEKYGDVVRVVDIGGFSRELCGGTHVDHLGHVGGFRIVSESSVQAGVRRIEAVTGTEAAGKTIQEHGLLRRLSHQLSAAPQELPGRIEAMLQQNKKLEKELKQMATEHALAGVDDLLECQKEFGGISVIAAVVENQPIDSLRQMMDKLRQKQPSGLLVLGSDDGGKAGLLCSVSDDVVEQGVHAGKLIAHLAKICGGGGGGKPNRAQAGGKDGSKVPEAIAAVEGWLAER